MAPVNRSNDPESVQNSCDSQIYLTQPQAILHVDEDIKESILSEIEEYKILEEIDLDEISNKIDSRDLDQFLCSFPPEETSMKIEGDKTELISATNENCWQEIEIDNKSTISDDLQLILNDLDLDQAGLNDRSEDRLNTFENNSLKEELENNFQTTELIESNRSNSKKSTPKIQPSKEQQRLSNIMQEFYEKKQFENLAKFLRNDHIDQRIHFDPIVRFYKIVVLFHLECDYRKAIEMIERSIEFPIELHRDLQKIWNDSHNKLEMKRRNCSTKLSAVQSFRLRHKHIYPKTIWDGNIIKYGMSVEGRKILIDFYDNVSKKPNQEQREMLARKANTSIKNGKRCDSD
ncbi:hypothetical protein QR98_0041250 [Sarcoptes scabiei]|uniref:Homeobox protein SIX1 N-terminal SD domain-containing protein n=1 Tax=Sarcoptes scabiei TaxID=52283 RepID=A0A132A481_SARSC|nr:hypothetical protein QR98_0041250 [Sarcoptes scabiei]